jgi:hypothetical protein
MKTVRRRFGAALDEGNYLGAGAKGLTRSENPVKLIV